MKKIILGVFITILISTTCNLVSILENTDKKIENIAFFINNMIIQGNYILFPLTGRCSSPRMIKYFDCDKFQQLINIKRDKYEE